MTDRQTLDTNILIYAFGQQEDRRKQIAKTIINQCHIISIQALNETIFVLHRKFNFHLKEISKIIRFIKHAFIISDLNTEITQQSIKISEKYGFSFWDSMIIAAALENNCSILFTEDLQHKQIIEGSLQIINPFQ